MYQKLQDIIEQCNEQEKPFWQVVLETDAQEKLVPQEEIIAAMRGMLQAMKEAEKAYDAKKSASNMVGTDAKKLEDYFSQGSALTGGVISRVMVRALKMGECNACMKRIVAAPTAGSCGVLPAVLLSVQEENHCSDEELVQALFVAGGIGEVIAMNASIAGAQGGCQAEIGSASAMAAGALTSLLGGNAEMICHSAAIALKGLLGLVCDPVAGLVEVPCVKRNVIGAVNAVTSAQMALAGIRSVILPDEVIDAMDEIGQNMSSKYRETGEGGLAATPSAKVITEKLH
jgi:L-serine dehydratase